MSSFLAMPALLFVLGLMFREGAIPGEEAVLDLPVVGPLYEWIFNPITYYRLDTALMFQESVRRTVMDVVGGMRNEQGRRALTDEESQPNLKRLAGD